MVPRTVLFVELTEGGELNKRIRELMRFGIWRQECIEDWKEPEKTVFKG